MIEQTITATPNYETDTSLERDLAVIQETENFIRTSLGATSYKGLHPNLKSEAAIQQVIDEVRSGKISLDIMAPWALEMVGYVKLRSSLREGVSDEEVEKAVGFVDEDSFAFVWEVMDRISEVDAASLEIERTAERMLTQFTWFTQQEDGYERLARDPRLAGIFHLHAAVELAQIRDFEAALTELEFIQEPGLRDRFMKLLAEVFEADITPVDADESRHNLEKNAEYICAREVPPVDAEIDTRVTSNRSLNTFLQMFDPLSEGRVKASVYGYENRPGKAPSNRPSSGDHSVRQNNERMLGHQRRLFSPRVIYGSVIQAEHIADKDDPAWSYGQARFVLKEDSSAVRQATFAFGDTLNGRPFTLDRRLLRSDADRGSKILQDTFQGHRRDTGHGSLQHYIEAQVEGLHIKDIEAIVLRPRPMPAEESDVLMATAETAALHGIDVSCVFDWQGIKSRNGGHGTEELVNTVIARMTELKARNPHVRLTLEVGDETDSWLFAGFDQSVASIS